MPNYTVVDEARDLIKPYVDTGDSAQESLTRSTVGWTGKNILPVKLDDIKASNTAGSWSGNVYTHNSVTFTVNSDKSITINGTATGGDARIDIYSKDNRSFLTGQAVTITGFDEGASTSTYYMYVNLHTSSSGSYAKSINIVDEDGETYNIEGTRYLYMATIKVISGTAVSNKTIKPMIRDAKIKDSTYEPHHESVEVELIPIINKLRTDRRNISDKVSELSAAVQANDIYSAGFSIGDYFESPTAHELTQESWNSSTSTLSTSTVSVKFLYHLAHQNQYYGGYNNNAVIDKRTATILVDTKVNRQWHSGDASAVGYSGSKLQTFLAGDVLDAIKADIAALTGDTWSDHLVAHNKLFTTGLSAWAWSNNQYISAPTESQFYGHTEWTANSYQEGEAVMQLELMRKYRWNEIFGNMWIWLRNMQAASVACTATTAGIAYYDHVVNTGRAAGLIEFH